MITLRDHYFVAWLHAAKQVDYYINKNSIVVDMSRDEYTIYLEEYKNGLQPILKTIRLIVKDLSKKTSTSNIE